MNNLKKRERERNNKIPSLHMKIIRSSSMLVIMNNGRNKSCEYFNTREPILFNLKVNKINHYQRKKKQRKKPLIRHCLEYDK